MKSKIRLALLISALSVSGCAKPACTPWPLIFCATHEDYVAEFKNTTKPIGLEGKTK